MNIAHDVFAETNPAFCAVGVLAFTKAYLAETGEGPEFPLIYLALPLALSGDIGMSFNGTNKNTGLLEWLGRDPRVQLNLAARLNATMGIVTGSIRFACFVQALEIGSDGRLKLGPQKVKQSAIKILSKDSVQVVKYAERLGHWFGMAGSTRTVFDVMGLTV